MGYIHLLTSPKVQPFPWRLQPPWYYGLCWLLTAGFAPWPRIFYRLCRVRETSPGITRFFLSTYLPHLLCTVPYSYWSLTCFAALPLCIAWCSFCSSDQRFAFTFLQIPLAVDTLGVRLYPSHCRADLGLSPFRNVRCRAHKKPDCIIQPGKEEISTIILWCV